MTKTAPAASAPIAAPGVSRFAGLDGLRAIAVLLVMFFHLSPGFVPGGYLGVDVFFDPFERNLVGEGKNEHEKDLTEISRGN